MKTKYRIKLKDKIYKKYLERGILNDIYPTGKYLNVTKKSFLACYCKVPTWSTKHGFGNASFIQKFTIDQIEFLIDLGIIRLENIKFIKVKDSKGKLYNED